MHVKVKELLAKAAYNGITRKAISARAGIAPSSFTNWRNKNPRLDTLDKAEKALEELIEETMISFDEYMADAGTKFVPQQTPFLDCIGKTDEKVEG